VSAGAERLRRATAWLLALGVLIVALMGGVGWVQWRQSALMSQASLVGGDNMMHFLYQADNEYLRLREGWPHPGMAAPVASHADGAAETLQLRYEIFVSRINVLRNALKRHDLREDGQVMDAVARAERFIARADRLFDPAAPMPSWSDLVALRSDLEAMGEPMRELALQASSLVNIYGTRVSEAGRAHNRLGIGMSVLLALLALAFAGFSLRQLSRLQQRRAELERLTGQLAASRQAAEAAAEAKGAFLANMSHEIRTPFQGLQGMLRLLSDTRLDERQRAYLRTASASADHLLTLLNDVLDMSRLESGRMTLVPGPVRLRTVLEDVEALMRPQAESKGLAFSVVFDPSLPARVSCDVTRVRQIIFNLLSNALKFTERGEVRLTLEYCVCQEGGLGLCLAVSDTGIGMDEATLGRLFQRFSQGDASRARRFGGTGLGLEISRSLARLMGGDIEATSRLGQGSTFRFTMPLQVLPEDSVPSPGQPALDSSSPEAQGPSALGDMAAAAPPQAATRPPAAPVSVPLDILVADDNEVNRMVMEATLAHMGHSPAFAEEGRQALAMAASRAWDLILMDLHMPEMDGLEAARAIRALPDPARARVRIVALTADVFPETREHVTEAGMDGFLTKPIDQDALVALLAEISTVRTHGL
jgi:signal transduction histidine kinase/CheY-like chemotaxis protein